MNDPRIPVRFGPLASRAQDEAVLTDGPPAAQPSAAIRPGPLHTAGCTCCTARPAATLALAALFRARVTGPAFRGVLAAVTPQTEAALRAALAGDSLLSARFRLD